MIGQQRERNVVRSLAAVSGEERCVTTLKTAARETRNNQNYKCFLKIVWLVMAQFVAFFFT